MAGFLSLRYVGKVCSDAVGGDDLIFQRRAYHWRSLGKVLPDGPGDSRGKGNSRRYSETTVPLIAVMLQISNRLSSIEQLDAISRAIQRSLAGNKTPFARYWTAALARVAAGWEGTKAVSTAQREATPQSAPPDGAAAEAALTAQQAEIQREYDYLTIAFPCPAREAFVVRCGSMPIFNEDDVDVYVLDLGFIFYGLMEAYGSLPQRQPRRIRGG